MEGFMEILQQVLFDLSCIGLAGCGVVMLLCKALPNIWETFSNAFGRNKITQCVFILFAVGVVMYGGTKSGGQAGSQFIFDKYITDNGSYSTNDTVVIKWKQVIENALPLDTPVYIEYKLAGSTNDWEALSSSAQNLGNYEWQGTLANATNYNYNIYCYYIPPAPVHTNGVWTYNTLKDTHNKNILPLRAEVRDNGSVIATPKSKWDAATRTPDDYVQDGLVAMWDGEWNAGRGKHDSNASAWVDLIGGLKITTRYPFGQVVEREKNGTNFTSRIYFSDNAVICEMMHGWTISLNSDNYAVVPKELYSFFELTNLTVEAVVNYNNIGGPAYDSGFQGRSSYSIIGSITDAGIGDIPWFMQRPNRFYPIGCIEKRKKHTVTIVTHDWNWSTYGQNGVLLKDIQATRSTNYKTVNILYTGWYGTLGQSISYNWRLYNRALTAEEVAHNYAIDKARFGSGNE